MVTRRRHSGDRREVVVKLHPAGEAVLRKLARYSLAELRTEAPAVVASLTRLVGKRKRGADPRGTARRR